MFDKKILKHTILFLAVAELFSLVGYIFPEVNTAAFFVILGLVLVIALSRFEWALYIVLAELFVGSFGRLFSWEIEGATVSLRIGIFLVIMAAWLSRFVKKGGIAELKSLLKQFLSDQAGRWFGWFALALLWGVAWGAWRNDFGDVFFDFNNWLYLLYILPFWQVFKKDVTLEQSDRVLSGKLRDSIVPMKSELQNDNLKGILSVLAGSMLVLSVKTLILEWFFAHEISGTIEMLYRWVRDFGIGEITFYASNFYRVFIQGQVWLLLGFFLFFCLRFFQTNLAREDKNILSVILYLSSIALLISFSRSLWLGWVLGLGALFILLLFRYKWGAKNVFGLGFKMLGILVLELLLIVALINVPPVRESGDFGSLVSRRVTQIEAAGSSRINLLKPLGLEIAKHPVIGSGFGSTVTYNSVDPRILGSTAGGSGEYTTYAFEWSYLDMLLKFGLAGLAVFLILLWQLFNSAWRRLHRDNFQELALTLGFMSAFIALLLTNVTTPYLNHPLGIGFIILMAVLLGQKPLQKV